MRRRRHARLAREITPLWADLTRACPEVILPGAVTSRQDPSERLYRLSIETRDALLTLRDREAAPTTTDPMELVAWLTHVVLGQPRPDQDTQPVPSGSSEARDETHDDPGTLDDDAQHLADLARAWVRRRAHHPPTLRGRRT